MQAQFKFLNYTNVPGEKHGLAKVNDAAAYLQLSRSRLYELMEAGELAFLQLPRGRRIAWKELDAWIEKNTKRM